MTENTELPGWLVPIKRLATLAPLYIAYPLATFLGDYAENSRAARLALFSLCESVEALVRFLAIVRSIEIIEQHGSAPGWLGKAAAENLLVPTFGKWMSLLRIIAAHEAKNRSLLLPELADVAARLDRQHFAS